MLSNGEKITWLASYPKSGNTWIRCLLQAYSENGLLDIRDLHLVTGDSATMFTQAVSPVPVPNLGYRGIWLVRPAALLTAVMSKRLPRIFKTHYANIQMPKLPPFIPMELTERAVYVVRDPRSVVLSLANFYSLATPKAVGQMKNEEFAVAMDIKDQTPQILASWSTHVASWLDAEFPVHIVKYEDLCADPLKGLKDLLDFLGYEFEEPRAKRAVKAAQLSRMQKQEKEHGFKEYNQTELKGPFFNKGGARWKEELGPKWIAQIEEDHREVMQRLGYLED